MAKEGTGEVTGLLRVAGEGKMQPVHKQPVTRDQLDGVGQLLIERAVRRRIRR